MRWGNVREHGFMTLLLVVVLFVLSLVVLGLSDSHLPGAQALDPNDDEDNDGYKGNFSEEHEWNYTNLEEFQNNTNPFKPDTDDDGCDDSWEVHWGFDPRDDSDGSEDPDNDGFNNSQEFEMDTNPLQSGDTDRDGMPDLWETRYGFDPNDPDDAYEDADNDGLTNLDEFWTGTHPREWDTDGDGMPDGWEVDNNLDPLIPNGKDDTDRGGVSNFGEYLNDTDPLEPSDDLGEEGNRGGGNGDYGIPYSRQLLMDTGSTQWGVKEWDVFLQAPEALKRWQSLDAVSEHYRMFIHNRTGVPEPVRGGEEYSTIYYLHLNISARTGELTPIPSPTPDSHILYYSYNESNGTSLDFYKDSADNLYIEPDQHENATLFIIFGTDDDYHDDDISGNWKLSDIPDEAKVPVPQALVDVVTDMLDNDLAGTDIEDLQDEDDIETIIDALVAHCTDFSLTDTLGEYNVPNPDASSDLYQTIISEKVGAGRHRAFAFFTTANALGLPTRYVSNEIHAFVEVYIPFGPGYSASNWRLIDLGGPGTISDVEARPPALMDIGTKIYISFWSVRADKGDQISVIGSIADEPDDPLPYFPLRVGMNDTLGRYRDLGLFSADSDGDFALAVDVPDQAATGPNDLILTTQNFSRYAGKDVYRNVNIYSDAVFIDTSPGSAPNGTTVYITGYIEDIGGVRVPGGTVSLDFDTAVVGSNVTATNGLYNISLALSHSIGEHDLNLSFAGTTYVYSASFSKNFLVKDDSVILQAEVSPDIVNSGGGTTIYANLTNKDGDPIPAVELGTVEVFVEGISVKQEDLVDVMEGNNRSFRLNITIPTSIQTGTRAVSLLYTSPPASIYPDGQAQDSIEIRAIQTELLLAPKIGQGGNDITIDGYLVSGGQGLPGESVDISWGDVPVDTAVTDNDGYFSLVHSIDPGNRGEYVVEAHFLENLPYAETRNTTTYTVYMATTLTAGSSSHPTLRVIRGETITVMGTLTNNTGDPVSGYDIEVYIDDQYNTTITTSAAGFSFDYPVPLSHELGPLGFRLVFEAEDHFMGSEDSLLFEIGSNTTIAISSYPGYPADPGWMNGGETLVVEGNLSDNAGNPLHDFSLSCQFNGNVYQNTTASGSFIFVIPTTKSMVVGYYFVTVDFQRTGYHLAVSESVNMKIMRETWVEMEGLEVKRNETLTIEGHIYDSSGAGLENAQLNISVDSSPEASVFSDEDGYFSYPYFIEPDHALGPISVTAEFAGAEFYHGNDTSASYEVWSHPAVRLLSGNKMLRGDFVLHGQVVDDLGDPLSGQDLTIDIDEKDEHFMPVTDGDGNFSFNVSSATNVADWAIGPRRVNLTLPEQPYRKEAKRSDVVYLSAKVRFILDSLPEHVDHGEPFELTASVRDEYGAPLDVTFNLAVGSYFKFNRSEEGQLRVVLNLPPEVSDGEQQLMLTTPYTDAEYVFPFWTNLSLIVRTPTELTLSRNFGVRGETNAITGALREGAGAPLAGQELLLNFSNKEYQATTDGNGNFSFSVDIPPDQVLGSHAVSISFDGSYNGSSGHADTTLTKSFYVFARTKVIIETKEGHYLNARFQGKLVDAREAVSDEAKTPLNLSVEMIFNGLSLGMKKLHSPFNISAGIIGDLPYTVYYHGTVLPEDGGLIVPPQSFFLASDISGTLYIHGHLTPSFEMKDVVEVGRTLRITATLWHDYDPDIVTHTRLYLDKVNEENLIGRLFTNNINFSWVVPKETVAGVHSIILVEDEVYADIEFYRAVANTRDIAVIQRTRFLVERSWTSEYLDISGRLLDSLDTTLEPGAGLDNITITLFINGIQGNISQENPFHFRLNINEVYGLVAFTLNFNGSGFYLPAYYNFTEIIGVDTRMRITVPEKLTRRELFDLTVKLEDIHGMSVTGRPLYILIGNLSDKNSYSIDAFTKSDGTYRSELRFRFTYDVQVMVYFNGTEVNGTQLYNHSSASVSIQFYEPKEPMTPKERLIYGTVKYSPYIIILVAILWVYLWQRKNIALNLEAKLNKAILEKKDELDIRELIIRVYKQMRLYLQRKDMLRNPAETIREFKVRTLQLLNLSERGVGRLSTIFEWVDYSKDKPGKSDGIEALNSLDVVEGEVKKG